MKVRIQTNGAAGYMASVTDVETNEVLENVTHVGINIDVREVVTATITTLFPVVDIIADAEIKQVCPCCGKPVEPPPLQGNVPEQLV
jgi:hypothetical protein